MIGITRICRLRDCGVFRDFTWPSDLSDFGRYNLIYGWNWTGKTTLSRVFRALELRQRPAIGQALLRIDGSDVRVEEFPQSNLHIRVFNRDYIEESVFRRDGGDLQPIFVIGKESVEKHKEADRLKAERATKENALNAARGAKQQAERDFDKHCIDRAKAIKDTLRVSGPGAYNDYDKRDYERRAEQMATDGDSATHRLSEMERDRLRALHGATPKSKVPEVAYSLPRPQDLATQVGKLLRATVISAAIQTIKDDSVLAEWTRHGLGLHKERRSETCLFCEQPLPKGRLAELEAHFNAEYERFLQSVDDEVQSLESARRHADELRVPHRAELYDDLGVDYDGAEQALRQAVDTLQAFIKDLIEALNAKKAAPFRMLSLPVAVPVVDDAVVDRLNEVIRRHNAACDDFDRHVGEARNRLALDMIAESLDEFVRIRDAVQVATAATTPIQAEIAKLAKAIDQLERDITEHRRPAEELTEDLKRYLGHGELQLTIRDTGYAITRNGVPATTLSEGEMTAIALLYFLKSLEDQSFHKQNGVVVLDDPVSSLDGNALYLAFGLIRDRTKDVGQLILMTHDFTLFRQARNWLHFENRRPPKPGRFYMLECVPQGGERSASLRSLDPLLERYESEYHYLFAYLHGVHRALRASSLEDYYHVPNAARRLLEGFLSFKFPQAAGDLYPALQLVSFDGSRKTRILRFLHTQSHGNDLVPGHDPSALGECPSVLGDLFDLIRAVDEAHFSAMEQLVAGTEDSRED